MYFVLFCCEYLEIKGKEFMKKDSKTNSKEVDELTNQMVRSSSYKELDESLSKSIGNYNDKNLNPCFISAYQDINEYTVQLEIWLYECHGSKEVNVIKDLAKKHLDKGYNIIIENGNIIYIKDDLEIISNTRRTLEFSFDTINTDITNQEIEYLYNSIKKSLNKIGCKLLEWKCC